MEFDLSIHTKITEDGKTIKVIGKKMSDNCDKRVWTFGDGNVSLKVLGRGWYEVEYDAKPMHSLVATVRGKKLADGVYRFYNYNIA